MQFTLHFTDVQPMYSNIIGKFFQSCEPANKKKYIDKSILKIVFSVTLSRKRLQTVKALFLIGNFYPLDSEKLKFYIVLT